MDGIDRRNQNEQNTFTCMRDGKEVRIRIAPFDPNAPRPEVVIITLAEVIRAAEWQQLERIESDEIFAEWTN